MIDELLARVDVLPPSLVLAQAAIESGWGRSRFAAEGNNVFGLRGSRGRGLIPRGRGPYEKHTVRAFSSLQSCIDFYMWNINTNPEYEDLRQIRRQRQSLCDPIELAQGLKTYSEMGCDYVDDVVELIRNNNQTLYDRYRLNTRDLYAFESRRSQDLL
jgi:Bax protein